MRLAAVMRKQSLRLAPPGTNKTIITAWFVAWTGFGEALDGAQESRADRICCFEFPHLCPQGTPQDPPSAWPGEMGRTMLVGRTTDRGHYGGGWRHSTAGDTLP